MVLNYYVSNVQAEPTIGSNSIDLRSKRSENEIISYPTDLRNQTAKAYSAFLDLVYTHTSDTAEHRVPPSRVAYKLLDQAYVLGLMSGTIIPDVAESSERTLNAIRLL